MGEDGTASKNITGLLQRWAAGNLGALNEVLPEIYSELRRMAEARLRGRQGGLTLDAPALVNEAYLRLVHVKPAIFESRADFFALAATMMRHILVDHVRARNAAKRGGKDVAVTLTGIAAQPDIKTNPDLLDVDAALTELALVHEGQARIVEMRYFAGLSAEQTADLLKLSPATVKREWMLAKAWLKKRLTRGVSAQRGRVAPEDMAGKAAE
jgi:RNA polymerase sigma factor (TIGR02999 family)